MSVLEMASELCVAVESVPPGERFRQWTLREDNQAHYHSVVSLSESPLYLQLSWRATKNSPPALVGKFKLDLQGLLAGRYIREEPVGSSAKDVRVRIVRAPDGRFFIQANQDGPKCSIK
jgi:hypothetical protein